MGGGTSRFVVFGLVVVLAACTGDGDADDAITTTVVTPSDDDPTADTDASDASDAAASAPDTTDATDVVNGEPLGFVVDRFEVDPPAQTLADGLFDDSGQLLATGVDAGVWSEIEAVRAMVSVLVGEQPPSLVPALDEMSNWSLQDLLPAAERLLEDPSIDPEQRADLARLTTFFFGGFPQDRPEVDLDLELYLPEPTGLEPQGLLRSDERLPALQTTGCTVDRAVREVRFGAIDSTDTSRFPRGTEVTYCVVARGEDTVWYPLVYEFVAESRRREIGLEAAARVLDLVERARERYLALSGTELPPVGTLISPRLPAEGAERGVLAMTRPELGQDCRVGIFLSTEFLEQGPDFDFIVAHELAHCLQGEWGDAYATPKLVLEGGANFFAAEFVGCAPIAVRHEGLVDRATANGSLLETSYGGWPFWAYLTDHRSISTAAISEMHRRVVGGESIPAVLEGSISSLGAALNEFYVRLLGPGLRCGTTGSAVTGETTVEDVGEVTFGDAPWVGTRYRVIYGARRYFAEIQGDSGPIGMANIDEAASPDAWVVVEPEIRTSCADDENWYVVLASAPGQSGGAMPDRMIEVTDRQDPECDPCPIGSWTADMVSYERFINSFDPAQQLAVAGAFNVAFAGGRDGGPTLIEDDQDVMFSIDGQGVQIVGGGSGQWTGDETDLGINSYSGTGTSTFQDISTTGTDAGGGGLQYSCDDDVLSIVANGVTIAFDRVAPAEGEPYPFGGG